MHAAAVVFFVLAATVAAAPRRNDSDLSCNVGNLEHHSVAHGFKACVATYDFGTGNTELYGRHTAGPVPFDDQSVPGMETTRHQECQVKNHRGSMQVRCVCYSSRCNAAVSPLQLIEEKFSNL